MPNDELQSILWDISESLQKMQDPKQGLWEKYAQPVLVTIITVSILGAFSFIYKLSKQQEKIQYEITTIKKNANFNMQTINARLGGDLPLIRMDGTGRVR